jgi:hypothetical protein
MSTPYPSLANRAGGGHPAVVSRLARERLRLCLAMLIPALVAFAISLEMPQPTVKSEVEIIAIVLGLVGLVALAASTRYTVSLTVLVFYLGLLDGPVKLEAASKYASGVRDLMILAIGVGMLMRLSPRRERVTLPPLSGWVLGFVAVALVEALNPGTHGFLKILGGYRQVLEFVPLFFFAYLIMRSKQRLRQLFLILGVIALANGLVAAYQSRITPGALAAWGPGYGERVTGEKAGGGKDGRQTGRTYAVEGVAHNRPPALGSDSGFGGGVGVLALAGLMALLVTGGVRRRWPVLLCSMGALLGIATSASRTTIVVAVVTLLCFFGLSLIGRLRVARPLAGLIAVAFLAAAIGVGLVAADGSQIFHRQETILKVAGVQESGVHEYGDDGKEKALREIPRTIADAPFGLGLGTTGAVAGFGGHEKVMIESEKVDGSATYNLLAIEMGAPGLLLWIGLSLTTIILGVTRLRRIADPELRMYLVAVLATFIGFTVQGLSGQTLAVTPAGAYVWFAPGIIAYWFAGPGRAAMAGVVSAGKGRAMPAAQEVPS